ncbi:hypothetical protein D3C87_1987830 [compost metagenome]
MTTICLEINDQHRAVFGHIFNGYQRIVMDVVKLYSIKKFAHLGEDDRIGTLLRRSGSIGKKQAKQGRCKNEKT